jgi:hypothetical protein
VLRVMGGMGGVAYANWLALYRFFLKTFNYFQV